MADTQLQPSPQQEMPGQAVAPTRPAIPVRKTLLMVNEFVVSTASFLNHFAAICEDKLDDVARKLSRLENEVVLLEKKLDSIPGLAPSSSLPSTAVPDVQPTASGPAAPPPGGAPPPPPPPVPAAAPAVPVMTAAQDPMFAKYFKLINLGMPAEQVKLKMQAEGFDPSVIDNPNGPSPNAAPAAAAGPPAAAAAPPPAPPAPSAPMPPPPGPPPPLPPGAAAPLPPVAAPAAPVLAVKDDPMYRKYFKMLDVGVPLPAVKVKMTAEGVDPSVIDMNPNAPSPNAGAVTVAMA